MRRELKVNSYTAYVNCNAIMNLMRRELKVKTCDRFGLEGEGKWTNLMRRELKVDRLNVVFLYPQAQVESHEERIERSLRTSQASSQSFSESHEERIERSVRA